MKTRWLTVLVLAGVLAGCAHESRYDRYARIAREANAASPARVKAAPAAEAAARAEIAAERQRVAEAERAREAAERKAREAEKAAAEARKAQARAEAQAKAQAEAAQRAAEKARERQIAAEASSARAATGAAADGKRLEEAERAREAAERKAREAEKAAEEARKAQARAEEKAKAQAEAAERAAAEAREQQAAAEAKAARAAEMAAAAQAKEDARRATEAARQAREELSRRDPEPAASPVAVVSPAQGAGDGGYASYSVGGIVLKPQDVVTVVLRGIPAPEQIEDQIDDEGNISLPLLGEVRAAGYNATDLEREIRRQYIDRKIYQNINVTVIVPSRFYFMQGEVRGPGRYQLVQAIRLSQAIAQAGGYTEFASKEATITRDGKLFKKVKNTRKLSSRPEDDILLEPGDIVEIKRSFW
jgi:protein involved in polysaccharide export with SLBB domain